MQANFPAAAALIMSPRIEGGYSDRATDPGGKTNLGITIATLGAYLGRTATEAEVRALRPDTAAAIYRNMYWAKIRGDDLPSGLDLMAFDCAVNQGVGRVPRLLQLAVGATPDGIIGKQTLAMALRKPAEESILEMAAQRMKAYGDLRTLFGEYGLGWSRRLMLILQTSLELNAASAPSV